VKRRSIEWIWHIRGRVALAPGQSSDAAFARLDPLFREPGTSCERVDDTLVFRKKDQAAQDRMSVFDSGVLSIEPGEAAAVLRYDLISRALLFCFLAPLLFLGIAQLTIAVVKSEPASSEAAAKSGKASDPHKKSAEEQKVRPLNPIDKALGAPDPEKPKKKGAKDADDKDKDKKPSPKAAYIFAGIFAALYIVGRILEDWLIRRLFRNALLES
jgi:hypothetical protein